MANIVVSLVGIAVAIAVGKPLVLLLALGGILLLIALDKRTGPSPLPGATVEEKKKENPSPTLGAGCQSNSSDGGIARFYGPESTAAVNPELYPVPYRVKERRFWEDPTDPRMRWHVSGPEGPYTAWRGVNGIW